MIQKTTKTQDISLKLINIMEHHKGKNNAILARDLFRTIYGHYANRNNARDAFSWMRLRQCMNYLRKKTYCFIVYEANQDGMYEYFIPTTMKETLPYQNRAQKSIEGWAALKKKVQQSVLQKWHERDWELPTRTKQITEVKK